MTRITRIVDGYWAGGAAVVTDFPDILEAAKTVSFCPLPEGNRLRVVFHQRRDKTRRACNEALEMHRRHRSPADPL